jgi:hypothetical protein
MSEVPGIPWMSDVLYEKSQNFYVSGFSAVRLSCPEFMMFRMSGVSQIPEMSNFPGISYI